MSYLQKTILTLLLTCSCLGYLCAQVDTLSIIAKTKSYAQYLDSVNKPAYSRNHGYATTIADGIIKRNDIIIGGFSIYTLSNAAGDTAFRIEYHDNLDINIYKTYYYKNNKLIYATVELQGGRNNSEIIYQKEEFYDDGQITRTILQQNKKAKRYSDKTNFSLYHDGLKFLEEFKAENDSR